MTHRYPNTKDAPAQAPKFVQIALAYEPLPADGSLVTTSPHVLALDNTGRVWQLGYHAKYDGSGRYADFTASKWEPLPPHPNGGVE